MRVRLRGAAALSVIVCVLFVLALAPTHASGADRKTEAIRSLLDETGSMALAKQLSQQVLPEVWKMVQQQNPDISDDFVAVMNEEFNRAFDEKIPDLYGKMIGVYDTYFTAEEIDGLLAFYRTDLGKRLIAVTPALSTQIVSVSQDWSGNVLWPLVAERVDARLREAGQ